MPNPENLIPHRMKKGETVNPNGRPKKVETIIKEYFLTEHNTKLSKSQAGEIIMSILAKSREELLELGKQKDLPFWISLIVSKATKDYNKGSIEILEKLFDRVYGKPKEDLKVEQVSEIIVTFDE